LNPDGKETVLAKTERKKGNTGKRYSEAERKKILAFVEKYGRGGITAASRQYGVSYIALRRWMKHGPGGAPRGGRAKVELDGRKIRRVKTALATVKVLRTQITKLQATLKQLLK
jgi:transposase-like protein